MTLREWTGLLLAALLVAGFGAYRTWTALGEATETRATTAEIQREVEAGRGALAAGRFIMERSEVPDSSVTGAEGGADVAGRVSVYEPATDQDRTQDRWTPETAAAIVIAAARARGIEISTILPGRTPSGGGRVGATLRGEAPALAALVGEVEEAGGQILSLGLRGRGSTVEATIDVLGPIEEGTNPSAEAVVVADAATLSDRITRLADAEHRLTDRPVPENLDLAAVETLNDPFRVAPSSGVLAAPPEVAAAAPPPFPYAYIGRLTGPRGALALLEDADSVGHVVAQGETIGGYTIVEVGASTVAVRGPAGPLTVPLRVKDF